MYLYIFISLLVIIRGAESSNCYQKNALTEIYRGMQVAMEKLIEADSHGGTVQRVEILDIGMPLSHSDFNPGKTKRSAQQTVENAQPLVDKIYPLHPPLDSVSLKEYGYDSMSATYGYILQQFIPTGLLNSTLAAARAFLTEQVTNPELVVNNETLASRYQLYNHYRTNYLHMKALEDNAIDDSRQQLSSRNFEEWGQKELSMIESDTHTAFQKWQVFGYKYEVEKHLHNLDMDASEENKLLSSTALYKSMGERSLKDIHMLVYPVLFKPENWYEELKANPPQSTDELRYRKSLLLAQQAMLLSIRAEIDANASSHLSGHLDDINENLEELQEDVNTTVNEILMNEIDCFTKVNVSACSEINSGYTGFRYTLDQIAEHFAQVDFLESLLYDKTSNIELIDEKLEEVTSKLKVITAKIATAELIEQEESLDISISHSTPQGSSCYDCGAVKFSFTSESVTYGCESGEEDCNNDITASSSALQKSLWNIRSCSVDNELKSFNLYESFVSHMNTARFNITASLKKVVVDRPWFDVTLFKQAGFTLGKDDGDMVSPGPVVPSSYFQRLISDGDYLLPQYVHAIILASNIQIYYPNFGSWELSDDNGSSMVMNTLMEYAYASRLIGGIGPFNFETAKALDHNYQIRRKKFNGGLVLTLPGAQVVGYILGTVPKFPPEQYNVATNRTECECTRLYELTGEECLAINDNCTKDTEDTVEDPVFITDSENTEPSSSCPTGFYLDDNGLCADINECTEGTHLCNENSECLNTGGTYYCHCNSGYTLGTDGFTCEDIDECAESLDNCEHECLNSQGSFTCRCSNKYWLSSDGYSCEVTCFSQGLSRGCCHITSTQPCTAISCQCDPGCSQNYDCCPDVVTGVECEEPVDIDISPVVIVGTVADAIAGLLQ